MNKIEKKTITITAVDANSFTYDYLYRTSIKNFMPNPKVGQKYLVEIEYGDGIMGFGRMISAKLV